MTETQPLRNFMNNQEWSPLPAAVQPFEEGEKPTPLSDAKGSWLFVAVQPHEICHDASKIAPSIPKQTGDVSRILRPHTFLPSLEPLKVGNQGMFACWWLCEAQLRSNHITAPFHGGTNLPFASKFQIRLRIERKHGFYAPELQKSRSCLQREFVAVDGMECNKE